MSKAKLYAYRTFTVADFMVNVMVGLLGAALSTTLSFNLIRNNSLLARHESSFIILFMLCWLVLFFCIYVSYDRIGKKVRIQ